MSASDFERIASECSNLVQRLRDQHRRIARAAGLTPAGWAVLRAASDGGSTVPKVARRLGLSRQSIQSVADRLAESGHLRFVRNPDHRRSLQLELTDTGRASLGALEREARAREPDLSDDLEPEEVEATLQVLRAIAELL